MVIMTDISTELDSVIPRHQLLDNTAAKHKTDLIHRSGHGSPGVLIVNNPGNNKSLNISYGLYNDLYLESKS